MTSYLLLFICVLPFISYGSVAYPKEEPAENSNDWKIFPEEGPDSNPTTTTSLNGWKDGRKIPNVSLIFHDIGEVILDGGYLQSRHRENQDDWYWYYYESNSVGKLDWTKSFRIIDIKGWSGHGRRFHFKYATNPDELLQEYTLIFANTTDARMFICKPDYTKKH